MAKTPVLIVRTGTANLASVRAAIERLGAEPKLTVDPAAVKEAQFVVLPGVGAFGAAMAELEARGLTEVLLERVRAARPTLAICLGLQLLSERSAESPGVRGLGLVPGSIERLESARVPHFGWTPIEPEPGARLLQPGYAYFAHSYRMSDRPAGFVPAYAWSGAIAPAGGIVPDAGGQGDRFVAAFESGPVLACQFHPELSGVFGHELLQRWLVEGGQ